MDRAQLLYFDFEHSFLEAHVVKLPTRAEIADWSGTPDGVLLTTERHC